MFHVSCETGFGIDSLKSFILDKAVMRPWRYHPAQKSTFSEVQRAQQIMKQALFERYFKEIPYQVGIDVTGWVPKLSGELRIDYELDVRNKIQIGMLLGKKGRMMGEVKARVEQLMTEILQRPVTVFILVKRRKTDIGNTNEHN